ncbi:hypothetical protein [Kangiella japonica]|uniref:hypothetical protein n=1 Tax=Kangiella japonica TaxID=647384 RepID=UPI0031E463A7
MIPQQFEFCGNTISEGDHAYDELIKVLTSHKDGWVASYVTYIPTRVYNSPSYQVNVVGKQIVVSYKAKEGYLQFVKFVKYAWSNSCV